MRQRCLFLLIISILSCGKKVKPGFEMHGVINGINTGTCIITDSENVNVYGENISDGRFDLKTPSVKAGYYIIEIRNTDKTDSIKPCEVYLENGKYTLKTIAKSLYLYPEITSSSSIQNQLSIFYNLSDRRKYQLLVSNDSLNKLVSDKTDRLSTSEFNDALNKISEIDARIKLADVSILGEFVKSYPKNDITIHLMDNLHYGEHPIEFYKILTSLPREVRSSARAKEIDSVLSRLVNLVPGAQSPKLTGKMPDGKFFNSNLVSARLILVEFWDANTGTNLAKHADLLRQIKQLKGLEMISVAFKVDQGTWESAIQIDKLMPFKVFDVNGDHTADADNWMTGYPPHYYLIDNKWTVLKDDLYFDNIADDINRATKAK